MSAQSTTQSNNANLASTSSAQGSSSTESTMGKIIDKVTGREGGPNDGQGANRQSDSIIDRIKPATEAQHEKRRH